MIITKFYRRPLHQSILRVLVNGTFAGIGLLLALTAASIVMQALAP